MRARLMRGEMMNKYLKKLLMKRLVLGILCYSLFIMFKLTYPSMRLGYGEGALWISGAVAIYTIMDILCICQTTKPIKAYLYGKVFRTELDNYERWVILSSTTMEQRKAVRENISTRNKRAWIMYFISWGMWYGIYLLIRWLGADLDMRIVTSIFIACTVCTFLRNLRDSMKWWEPMYNPTPTKYFTKFDPEQEE